MAHKPHLFLGNPRGQHRKFNASRSFESPKIPEKAPETYRRQKDKLNQCLTAFNTNLQTRRAERTLDIPSHLEYIEVHFFSIFNNNDTFQTKSRFKSFGLSPVLYRNFNQSVVFAIVDEGKFSSFVTILENFIASQDNISPRNKSYSIATIIYDFEFLSTEKIGVLYFDNVILSLVNRSTEIKKDFDLIYTKLFGFFGSALDLLTKKA